MKTGLTTILAWALGSALLLPACASSDQQQTEENLEGSEEGNDNGSLGNDDAAEGNGQENFVDNGGDAGNQDEGTNNATGNDTDAVMDPTLNGASNAAMNAPVPANNPAGVIEDPSLAGGVPAAPAPEAAMAPAPAPAPAATEQSVVQGGRVRYVPEGGVQVVSAPGGAPVQTLEQGEHPVTWEENGWLKITNGMYVPIDAMSTKGVPRPQTGAAWSAN